METDGVRSIRRISVEKLFGLYDYSLAITEPEGQANKILILYGENGSGKTTILKLAFHLLAPEDGERHKSTVAPIPFRKFEIELLDRTKVIAERKKKELTGSFTLRIERRKRKVESAEFVADERLQVKAAREEQKANLLGALGELEIALYMLSDDRRVHLAGRKGERGGPFLRRDLADEWSFFEGEAHGRFVRRAHVDPEKIAQYLLLQSIKRAEYWIRSRAMKGSSIGESSVNAIYNEILKRLVALPEKQRLDPGSTKKSIERRVSKLEKECREFAKYGLMPRFEGTEIRAAVGDAPKKHLGIIARVLNPYLESLEKKLEALGETHRKVDALVTIVNRFLTHKALSFDLHSGLEVTAADGTSLEPHMLSSGERHLLLLFCNSLVAMDRPSVMMIDEPEISLNVKWQRKLLSSLLECVGDSPVQYIFATHSIEVLSQHKERVVKLEDVRKS